MKVLDLVLSLTLMTHLRLSETLRLGIKLLCCSLVKVPPEMQHDRDKHNKQIS